MGHTLRILENSGDVRIVWVALEPCPQVGSSVGPGTRRKDWSGKWRTPVADQREDKAGCHSEG